MLPEVQVVEIPNKTKCVVVIRVYESPQAPHAIANGTEVYVRKGDHTKPDELAELRWIEHLLERREKPERRREALIARARERLNVPMKRLQVPTRTYGTVWVCPTFPFAPLGSAEQVYDLFKFEYANLSRVADGVADFAIGRSATAGSQPRATSSSGRWPEPELDPRCSVEAKAEVVTSTYQGGGCHPRPSFGTRARWRRPSQGAPDEPGREILYPVAVVILGGLTSATLLDMIVTPAVFWKFGRKGVEKLAAARTDDFSEGPTHGGSHAPPDVAPLRPIS